MFTTGDITGFGLDRSLFFTMGCHAGLSVADIAVGVFNDNDQDWAQTYASQGALYAANTGYGYGDTTSVALSERLMAQFAERLDGTMTVGQAMIFAKQQYFGDLGLYGAYDEKALQEATFYGLPMYKLGTGTPAIPTPVTTTTDPVTGIQSTTVSASPVITQASTGVGQLFSVDGDVQFTHFRPLQPIVRTDVTPTDPTLTARGAMITSLTTTDITGVDIAYARPIIDLSANEQEVESDEMVFPTTFASVSLFNAPPGPSTVGPVARRQQLNIIAGQFTSPADGDTFGTERLFNDYDATVYYSDSADYTKPKLNQIQAALVGNQASFIVDVSDDVDVARVVALYRQATTAGVSTWVSVDLVEGSPWSGGGAVDPSALVGGKLDYLIQAIDSSGNVAVSTFKGLFHKAEELPPPPSGSGVEVSGTQGNNGWYTSSVTITVTGNPAVTIDGKSAIPNGSSVYVITDDGPHTVKVGDVTFGVLIDKTPPVIASGLQGAVFITGSAAPFSSLCVDAGSGVASCPEVDTSNPGDVNPSFEAEDVAGNTSHLIVEYAVVDLLGAIAVIDPIGAIDQSVEAKVSGTSTSNTTATWNWGDETSSTASHDGTDFTGEHVYTTPGVYPVTITVNHNDGRLIQSALYQYVVVYDPTGGFVTGGGWIDSPPGAYTPGDSTDPDVTGKANFGFVSKYKKGRTTPEGNTQFQFKAGDLKFKSTLYDWLVISGAKAQFKGEGTINGELAPNGSPYEFLLVAFDADWNENDSHLNDRFRIKIWYGNVVVYDNKAGEPDNSDEATALGGGSIVIHDGKKK